MAQHRKRLVNLPCSDPLLVCCLCECLLDNPQLLSCLHSCCLNCLQLCREHDHAAKPTCPICQEASSDVSSNIVVGSRVRRYEAIANFIICAMCADRGNDDQKADAWCTSCSKSFCEACLPYHRSCHMAHKITRLHVVSGDDLPMPSPLCSSHEKPLDFVCFSCKTCCCADCWPSCAQINHDIKHVSDPAVSSYIEYAQGELTNLARMLRTKTDVLYKRKQLPEALKSSLQSDLRKLQNTKQHLLKVIDDVCTASEARLRDTYDGLGATAEAISSSSETMERKVSQSVEYSLYVVTSGLASGLFMQEQRISSRMKALCSELDKIGQPLEAGQYVAFDSTLPDDEAQLVDLVTSWIGSPRAMTDDLIVRNAQREMSLMSTSSDAQHQVQQIQQMDLPVMTGLGAAQQQVFQINPVGYPKYAMPASGDTPLAEWLSEVDSTRRVEEASSTATMSIQAELSGCIAVPVAPAIAAAGCSSDIISRKTSLNEATSTEQQLGGFDSNLMERPTLEEFEELSTPIEYMLTCCLCSSLVQNPVLLNCLHTCCSRCFSLAASTSAPGDVACGACRFITQAGTEQRNRFVDSQLLLYSTRSKSKKCHTCRDPERINDPAVWCPVCQLSFCAECSEWHRLFKNDHCTELLSETNSSEVLFPQTLLPTCPIHSETLEACIDCQQTKCRQCWRECTERKHRIYLITDDSFNIYVENVITPISLSEKELNGKLKVLTRPHAILSTLKSGRADQLQQIISRKRQALEAVNTVYDRIESSTKLAFRQLEMEAEQASAEADRIESNFVNARSYLRRLVKSKRMHDIFDQHRTIQKHLRVLCAELDHIRDTVCKIRTTKIESSLPEDLVNVIKASIRNPLHSAAQQQVQQVQVHPLDSLKCAGPANGNTPIAHELSDVDSTRRVEGASSTASTATMSIQAELSEDLCVRKTEPDMDFASSTVVSVKNMAEAREILQSSSQPHVCEDQVFNSDELLAKLNYEETPADILKDLRNRLDAWKNVNINIGVIGASGTGKSTLINTLRRLKPEQPGAAKVGAVQMTTEPTPYSYPKNPSLRLWDLPVVGTSDFLKESYIGRLQIDKYDFFLIVSSARFTEDDIWFACELQQAGKQFHFVRTKVDIDIQNDKEDHPSSHDQKKLLDKLREDCAQHLMVDKFGDLFVALVCKDPEALDFPKLEEKMVFELKNFKRETLVCTMQAVTVRVIQEKTAMLLRRVDFIAYFAAAVALLPAVSTLLISGLIYTELKLYKEVYGLTDERLREIIEGKNLSKEYIDNVVCEHFWANLTLRKVMNEMSKFVNDVPRESARRRPLWKDIVSVFRFAHSFKATPRFLSSCIESMECAALIILDRLVLMASGHCSDVQGAGRS